MVKQILAITLALFTATACMLNPTKDALLTQESNIVVPTPISLQNIQISQGVVLPPYGLKVKADIAVLKIRVTSSKEGVTDRLEDIQGAIRQISTLAADDEGVDLGATALNQVAESSDRAASSSYIWSTDSASVILDLTTTLTEGSHDNLLESFITFDNFLKTVTLPETITMQALSIGSEISDPESYRPQLVAKVYLELEAIQTEYGQAVKFEVTGLHSGLKILQLSDTEYYLYIEPAIITKEF
jgi:hypothetical protein